MEVGVSLWLDINLGWFSSRPNQPLPRWRLWASNLTLRKLLVASGMLFPFTYSLWSGHIKNHIYSDILFNYQPKRVCDLSLLPNSVNLWEVYTWNNLRSWWRFLSQWKVPRFWKQQPNVSDAVSYNEKQTKLFLSKLSIIKWGKVIYGWEANVDAQLNSTSALEGSRIHCQCCSTWMAKYV